MKNILLAILFLFTVKTVYSETPDSKGRDFYLAYLPNYHNYAFDPDPSIRNGDSLYLFIVADEPTNGYILYTDRTGTTDSISFTISNINDIYTFSISWNEYELLGFNNSGSLGSRNQCEIISKNSFRVVTEKDVTVYAHQQAVTTSESFLVLPTDVLGKEYYILTFYSDDGKTDPQSGTPSEFCIVATEDTTTITIIPSCPTMFHDTVTQKIVLNKGEVYLVQALIDQSNLQQFKDLTGTKIKSDKPVSVFAGHQRASVPFMPEILFSSRDMLAEQMPPITSWGTNAFVTPFIQSTDNTNPYNDIFRILAQTDNTEIFVNDVSVGKINAGAYLEYDLTAPQKINASAPILVMAYKKTASIQASVLSTGDPLMMILPPVEQYGNYYRFMNIQAYENSFGSIVPVYTEQYISIIVPNSTIPSIALDSKSISAGTFLPIPNSKYSYANINVSDGVHLISANESFGLFVYGYGAANSYGYFGGMNLKRLDLLPKITTNSPICEGDDLLLFADSIPNATYTWSGPNGFKSNQQNPVISKAKVNQSGKYYLYATIGTINTDTLSIDILVNANLVSPGDSSLIFVGSAKKQEDYIKLNNAKPWDGGSIWLKNRFSVKQDFVTTFQFRTRFGNDIGTDEGSEPGADGFAFVMQNHNYPFLGIKGGSMGYTGITNSLAVEFDLYQNPWDSNGNHIAVQSMGAEPNQPDHRINGSCLGINNQILIIHQDSIYYVKIEYKWVTKTLQIYIDSTGKFDVPALIIKNLNLETYLKLEEGEYVYIGFTSGTGEEYQEHDLFDWIIPCKNQLVDVEDNNLSVNNPEILNIFPNPVSGNAVISYNIENESVVNLRIIDSYGQEISKPVSNEFRSIGKFKYDFDTSPLAEGVYLIVLQTDTIKTTELLLIVK